MHRCIQTVKYATGTSPQLITLQYGTENRADQTQPESPWPCLPGYRCSVTTRTEKLTGRQDHRKHDELAGGEERKWASGFLSQRPQWAELDCGKITSLFPCPNDTCGPSAAEQHVNGYLRPHPKWQGRSRWNHSNLLTIPGNGGQTGWHQIPLHGVYVSRSPHSGGGSV